jgi:Transglutaminase-like superfamily
MPPLTLLRAARRLAAFRPEARRFAARAWLAVPVVQASLALVGFKSTLGWVEAVRPLRRPGAQPVTVAEGSALVGGAFRAHFVGGKCLPQSVVQYLLHRWDGVPARLVLGVRRPDPGAAIEAHAWIEAGHGETGDHGFEPLFATETVGGAV